MSEETLQMITELVLQADKVEEDRQEDKVNYHIDDVVIALPLGINYYIKNKIETAFKKLEEAQKRLN